MIEMIINLITINLKDGARKADKEQSDHQQKINDSQADNEAEVQQQ